MSAIDKITRLTQQNAEFDMELRKRLNVASANSVLIDDKHINEIYEYCIENIIKQQANEFYKDFPLESIKNILIGDFVRMESFRRRDNFLDFCLALYQQIECMTNKLCEEESDLFYIAEKMWGCPAYVKTEPGKELSIYHRFGCSIAVLLFFGTNKKTGRTYASEKSEKPLNEQYPTDKIRTIVYFLGYKAMMKSSDYDSFKEITSLLNDIYQCRNMNHRGNAQNQSQQNTIAKIISLKSLYFLKFLGVLAQYVEYIKEGWGFIPNLKEYSDSIEK